MTVVFSDPPEPTNTWQARYEEVYQACKERPGEWAEFPGASCTSRRRLGYEYTYRRINGKKKYWVRYSPELDQTVKLGS